MYKDEKIYWKAYQNIRDIEEQSEEYNSNLKVIRGLSLMIVRIWQEWKADSRNYKPSMSKLQSYKDTLNRGKRLRDPDLQHYDSALQMVADCQDFLLLVVNYRRRSGCIVM